VTRKQIRDFLVFWEKLPDLAYQPGPEKEAWKGELRTRIGAIPDDTLGDFIEIWRRRYEQSEADRVSSASRANALLTLIGVITAATTLIVSSTAGAWLPLQLAVLVTGFLLLVSVAAAVWLAVRVQQVSNWDVPRVEPEAASSVRNQRLTHAVELMAAADQNRKRLNNVIGYLRDAQGWALIAIVLLVVLAPLAVGASFTKQPAASPATPVPTLPIPTPTSSPSGTPSAWPSPSPPGPTPSTSPTQSASPT
jgi:hypothetical protein